MAQSTEDRYRSKIDASGGPGACWPWIAGRTPAGSGRFWDHGHVYATRWGYTAFIGPIPDGLCVCHKCDNPPCQNPAHWFLGTKAENTADRDAKSRQAWGNRNGARTHPGIRRGSRNGRARMNESLVQQMRLDFESGARDFELMAAYGVGLSTVHKIVYRYTWRHVT